MNEDEQPESISSTRAPLLWVVLPLILGYALSHHLSYELPAWTLAIACLGALIAWWAHSIKGQPATVLWALCIGLSVVLGGWLWRDVRMDEPSTLWESLPAREASLEIEIERLFDTQREFGTVSGLALITNAPTHLEELEGKRLSFNLTPQSEGILFIRGQHWECSGELSYVSDATEDDFGQYLRQVGAPLQYRRGEFLEKTRQASLFQTFCRKSRDTIESLLREGTPERHAELAGVYVAMTLGRKSALDEQMKSDFVLSGTMHLFAISGLHVGMLAGIIFLLMRLLRVPDLYGGLFGLALVYLYVETTGAAPSAMRAFIMVACFWGAKFVSRKGQPFSALCASALLVLLWQPWQLNSVGFQLSYAVVTSILLFGIPLGEKLQAQWTPFQYIVPDALRLWQRAVLWARRVLLPMVTVSLSATLASAPLVAAYFGVFTPGAVVLNLLLFPFAGLILTVALASALGGLLFGGALSALINPAAWMLLWCMREIVHLGLAVPGLFFETSFINPNEALLATAAYLVSLLTIHVLFKHLSLKTFYGFACTPIAALGLVLLIIALA